jgi:Tfp pilus assembly protein PilF
VTIIAQQKGGAVVSVEAFTITDRISNALVSYLVYIGKTIWPSDLAVLYPYRQSLPAWQVIGAVLLMTAITVTVIRKAKRAPYLAMGWLWFAGTLVPVIGIVQVGIQARADRYTYVPLIGLFIMTAWGISELSRNWRYRRAAVVASSAAVVVCLTLVTRTQVGYWQNSFVLFEHALKVTENNYAIYYNRGTAYLHSGNYLKAIGDYDKAIEIKPNYARAYNNRGIAYAKLGNDQQAFGDFVRAIEILPQYAEAYFNRGAAYLNMDDFRQAEENYSKAIEINSQYAEAYYNRAYAYANLGNDRNTIEDLKTAARLGHQDAQNTLKRQGRGW